MNILDIIRESAAATAWEQGDNIPWNDPEFSERMLKEHLSQEHDLASRRGEVIDRHIAWIHKHVLGGRATRILDLCCGPGLYGERLAKRGHEYIGIDYSPASIAYAKRNVDCDRCTYVEGDVRRAEFGSGFGLVMMIYGEFNVFRPADAGAILDKINAALEPRGVLLLEPHTHDAVVSIGEEPAAWEGFDTGLFSDQPHLCLQRSHWDEAAQAATRQFFVIDGETGDVTRCAASYQAYSDDHYRELLAGRGFRDIELFPSLAVGDKIATSPLMAIVARMAANL